MSRYVIDAVTLLHLARQDVGVAPGHQLVAPQAIRSQALDLLLPEVSSGELTEKQALQHHDRMTETKIRVLGDRVSRRTAWRIAREQGWDSIADAEYVAVTRLQADAFVTVDAEMRARVGDLVPLARLEDLVAD